MENNKKQDRDEHSLIRMSAAARKNMGFDKVVEVSAKQAAMLNIFQAYAADVQALKKSGDYSQEELRRVGFVTQATYDKITEGKALKNIWISDTVHETLFGADPEFLLFRQNEDRVVSAASLMGKAGKIGSDGAMAEVRPDPSKTSSGLVRNIRNIFADANLTGKIDQYRWMAACYFKDQNRDYPVGGHIHIGNPKGVMSMSSAVRTLFFAMVNKILDELLALPMSRLDGNEPGSCRRTKCAMVLGGGKGYGFFGEWRKCDGRLEHRTLSGLWLMHPSLAKAVIGTAHAIVNEVYRLVDNEGYSKDYICPNGGVDEFDERGRGSAWKGPFNGWAEIPLMRDMRCLRSTEEMNAILNSCSASTINSAFVKKWYDQMKTLSTFKENENCIRALRDILRVPIAEINDFDKQIQKNWLQGHKFIVDF